jgi:spermidine synthase
MITISELQPVTRPYPLPALPQNMYYVEETSPTAQGKVSFVEDTDPCSQYVFRVSDIRYQGKTEYQSVLIADSLSFGRMLVLDGAIQSSEDDEEFYHEMLVQPAMLAHPEPRDVLIIGGGEGASLREVLVHESVRSATMVDLDQQVVELCQQHLPSWHRGAFEDPRVELVFGDGREFVESDDRLYDVVVIDVVDMLDNGPAQAIYTRQFYQHLKKKLRREGIVVVQAMEFSFLDDKLHAALSRTLKTVFSEVHSYSTSIPSFLSNWGFIVASDWFNPAKWSVESIDQTIYKRLGTYLSHLHGEFLKSRFSHCKSTEFLLSLPGPIIEDGVDFLAPPSVEWIEPEKLQFPILR